MSKPFESVSGHQSWHEFEDERGEKWRVEYDKPFWKIFEGVGRAYAYVGAVSTERGRASTPSEIYDEYQLSRLDEENDAEDDD